MNTTNKRKWDSSSDEETNDDQLIIKKTNIEKKSEIIANNIISELVEINNNNNTKNSNNNIIIKEEIIIKTNNYQHIPLFHGCRSVEEYERLNFIDQGTYGLVFKAKCKLTNDLVALKQIKFDANNTINSKLGFPITALREINILLTLKHINIINVREMVIGSSTDKIYMVMDYCDFDLKKCLELSIKPFSLGETKQIILQLSSALDYMHNKWYIHRDLKTSNILYNNNTGNIVLCDFGMARKFGSPIEAYTNVVSTLWYRSPDLLLGASLYSSELDMWSFGCIFAEILTGGKPLFPGQGELDQINKIFTILGTPTEDKWPEASSLPLFNKISYRCPSKSRLREFFPSYITPGTNINTLNSNNNSTTPYSMLCLTDKGYDLLSSLLHVDPKKRITANEAYKHEWLLENPKPTLPCLMPKFIKDE